LKTAGSEKIFPNWKPCAQQSRPRAACGRRAEFYKEISLVFSMRGGGFSA